MNLNTYKIFYQKVTEYTFFSATHRIFSRIDGILGYKESCKYNKIEIISLILSDYRRIKLEINNKRNYFKKTETHGD
jgi:hypothetical protein